MKNSQTEYRTRLHKVVHYIQHNLGEELTLSTLADAAFFSPFHFHRIFTALIGETPSDYVNRLRLEKAANFLLTNPSLSVTEIALICGFSSSATFSRSFKNHFGITATNFSKNCKTHGKNRKAISSRSKYLSAVRQQKPGPFTTRRLSMNVEIKQMPLFHLAYVANMEGYDSPKIKKAWDLLCGWAGMNDLFTKETVFIGVSFDNPDITPAEKCRYYACLTIPSSVTPRKDIGTLDLSGGKHAVAHFTGKPAQIAGAYQWLYGEWLPKSGFQPLDQPSYEIYHSTPDQNPDGNFVMDICMPIRPL
jgi:AraC family transcriptional regulator